MKIKIILFLSTLILISCYSIKSKTMKRHFKFYTEYNQFYIEDKGNLSDIGSADFWNEKAFNSRLAISDGIIGVGTQSYGNIKGEIELVERPDNNIDYSKYDHIVESGINIQSGKLQILNCSDGHIELSLNVVPGKYRVRVYSSNLASVKETDLANDTDDDYYRIEIWSSEEMERKVLKQYTQH